MSLELSAMRTCGNDVNIDTNVGPIQRRMHGTDTLILSINCASKAQFCIKILILIKP